MDFSQEDIDEGFVYVKLKDGTEHFDPGEMSRDEIISTLAWYLNYYVNEHHDGDVH